MPPKTAARERVSAADGGHGAWGLLEGVGVDGVAGLFGPADVDEALGDEGVGFGCVWVIEEEIAEGPFVDGEEAGADFAFGGDAEA